MNQPIKVSFVIPVYNMMSYLEECLDSLLNQTLKEIELICVDDGSTDGSFALLQEYESKHPLIQVLQNREEGLGAGHARNLGLDHATGEFVHVVDSDDYFEWNMAERLYEKAVETQADIVLFDVMRFDTQTGARMEDGTTLQKALLPEKTVFSGEDLGEHLFQVTCGAAWNKLLRRRFVEEYQFRFQVNQVIDDIFFTYTSLSVAKKIAVVEDKLLHYRTNNSLSQFSNKSRVPLSPVNVCTCLKQWMEAQGVFSCFAKSYYNFAQMFCQLYLYDLKEESNLQLLVSRLKESGLEDMGFLSAERECYQSEAIKSWVSSLCSLDTEAFCQSVRLKKVKTIAQGESCAIYGFGRMIDQALSKIKENHAICVAIVDGSQGKQGEVYEGITVTAPETLRTIKPNLVLIASPFYYQEMATYLIEMGFHEEQIILL